MILIRKAETFKTQTQLWPAFCATCVVIDWLTWNWWHHLGWTSNLWMAPLCCLWIRKVSAGQSSRVLRLAAQWLAGRSATVRILWFGQLSTSWKDFGPDWWMRHALSCPEKASLIQLCWEGAFLATVQSAESSMAKMSSSIWHIVSGCFFPAALLLTLH